MVFIFMMGLVLLVYLALFIFYKNVKKRRRTKRDELAALASKHAKAAKQEVLEKQQQLKAEYSKAYEDRKITIGTIKCPQCKWTGQWGTGMSYEEFFLYDLTVKHKLKVSLSIHSPSNLNDDAQYKCPQCKSINWEKV